MGQDISVSSVDINFGHTTTPLHRGGCLEIQARAFASSTHRLSFGNRLQGRKGGCRAEKACGFVPFSIRKIKITFGSGVAAPRRNRTGIVPPRHVIWRWALLWLESHRSCKPYHTKRPPPHLYYIQKPMRNQTAVPRLCIRPFMMRTTRISSTKGKPRIGYLPVRGYRIFCSRSSRWGCSKNSRRLISRPSHTCLIVTMPGFLLFVFSIL